MVISIPEDQAITSIDAEGHELIGPIAAKDCGGELISLALWLVAERAKGPASTHASLIATLPVRSAFEESVRH